MKLFPALLLFATSLVVHAGPSPNFEKELKPIFQEFCIRCHGPDKVEAELRIDQLDPDRVKGGDAGHWEDVLNQLSTGEMPPVEEDQPSEDERQLLVDWLRGQQPARTPRPLP